MLLGCIGDDFTGSTDRANMLGRGGISTIQTIGVPEAPLAAEVDAFVVELKSRQKPTPKAFEQSLRDGACTDSCGIEIHAHPQSPAAHVANCRT